MAGRTPIHHAGHVQDIYVRSAHLLLADAGPPDCLFRSQRDPSQPGEVVFVWFQARTTLDA